MGLAERFKNWQQQQSEEEAAKAQAAITAVADAKRRELEGIDLERQQLARVQTARLTELSPLLDILETRKLLLELRALWKGGIIDDKPSVKDVYSDGRRISDCIELGLRFPHWVAEGSKIRRLGGPNPWNETRDVIVAYKAGERKLPYSIQARQTPTIAFRIQAWSQSKSNPSNISIQSFNWVDFDPNNAPKAQQSLEDAVFNTLKVIAKPETLIRSFHDEVRRKVPFYRRPIGLLI